MSKVKGIGKVVLKMTSRKTLSDVLYVLDIHKNGFKMIFKSNKLVFTRHDMYAGKEYRAKGFEMNIMTLL